MRKVLIFLLLASLCLLPACGRGTTADPTPAPPSAEPVLPTEAPAAPADAPVPDIGTPAAAACVFFGDDGEQRALLELLSFRSERAGQLRVEYRVTNTGALALTRLRYTLTCLDGSGAQTAEPVSVTQAYLEQPLAAGETRRFERTHYGTGLENTASVRPEAIGADNERELAPWTEPQPNNMLLDFCNDPQLSARFAALDTDPPTTLRFQRDQEEDVIVTDPALIREVCEALQKVRIGEQSERNVDDGGFGYWFTMPDGSEFGFRFDFRTLFTWHSLNYEVLDMGGLREIDLSGPEE